MKAKQVSISLFLIMSLMACKDNEKKEVQNGPSYKITLNAIVEQDDTFQVFFKEDDEQTPFEEENSVHTEVKGNTTAQDIVFNLPSNIFPHQLRVDFGNNKNQPEIIINTFKVTYNDSTNFYIKGSEFSNYFFADTTFATIDKASGKIRSYVTKAGVYDPMVFSNQALTPQLTKLSN